MAIVRVNAAEARQMGGIARAKVESLTEADIDRFNREDGFAPADTMKGLRPAPASIRTRLGMSQDKFAKALGIPPATLRNWEQGRTRPDPVAMSFFALVADDPERAFRVLAPQS
jgi:putative transcriptional regulator